jgi:hypothetical protein
MRWVVGCPEARSGDQLSLEYHRRVLHTCWQAHSLRDSKAGLAHDPPDQAVLTGDNSASRPGMNDAG